MKREYGDYVSDLLDAARKIEQFVGKMSYEDFSRDEKTVFAVVRALEVIGEAVRFIPSSVRTRHRNIPWREMAGMRNKLIHEYFGVNKRVVWNTIKKDIPAVLPAIERMLDEAGETA